ncbi:MAG: hypothetical protein WCL39_12440, partial [Armatimonadota bacterium]
LSAVHNTASWKSALMTAAPFVLSALFLALSTVWRGNLAAIVLGVALGVPTAAMSVREIVKGRRPIWLTTWLAVALTGAFGLIGALLPGEFYAPSVGVQLMMVWLGLLLIVTSAAVWRIEPWRWIVIVLGVSCVLCGTLLTTSIEPFLISVYLATPIIVVLFSRSVFEQHPYGNATQASLFLLTVITLHSPGIPDKLHAAVAMPVVYGWIACAPGVVWLARVHRRPLKHIGIFAVLVLSSTVSAGAFFLLGGVSPGTPEIIGLVVMSAVTLLVKSCVIFIPLWFERVRMRNTSTSQPTIAV